MIDHDYQNKILEHYISIWGDSFKIYLWDQGPFQKLPYDFRVLEFSPHGDRTIWTYATCCMSQPEDQQPIELFIFSEIQNSELIELLTTVVYYHRNTSKLGLNHTLNFGKPWQKESKCEYGFISLPYLDGPDLENLLIHETHKQVGFYWLIPVTKAEVDFKKKFGVEALEMKFDTPGFDYVDHARKSLV